MDYEKFAEQLKTNNAFQEEYVAFMEAKNPQNDEATYAAIIEFAAAKGYTIAVEDIAAARAESRELDEGELQSVSGGLDCGSLYNKYTKCTSDYATNCSSTYTELENCWTNDECTNAIYYYARSKGCTTSTVEDEWCWASDECIAAVR